MIGQYKRIKVRKTDDKTDIKEVRIEDDNLVVPMVVSIGKDVYDVCEILISGDLIRQLVNNK